MSSIPNRRRAVKVPDCRSESEEADWWYANRDLVEDLLDKHGRRVGHGIDLDVDLVKPTTKAISIRFAEPDIKQAKALAASKGVGYQTYIRSVLHEVLQQKTVAGKGLACSDVDHV